MLLSQDPIGNPHRFLIAGALGDLAQHPVGGDLQVLERVALDRHLARRVRGGVGDRAGDGGDALLRDVLEP